MIESLLHAAIVRRSMMVVILKDVKAFERLTAELKGAYTRSFSVAAQSAIAAALDRLREMDVSNFGAMHRQSILQQLETRMGGEAMAGALAGPVINLSNGLFRLGSKEVGDSVGIDLAFGGADLDALDMVTEGNLFWVRNSWSEVTQQRFNDALTEFFDKGMTRQQLMGALATSLGEKVTASLPYWELLADHAATKTREMGRVTGYEQAGIDAVQVRAHLDARTTKICRSLHGRVITVRQLGAQRNAYLTAVQNGDKKAAKASWKMYPAATSFNRSTDKLPADIGSPPYHFRCRTITVAYFDAQATQATAQDSASWPESPHTDRHNAAFGSAPELIKAAIFRHDEKLSADVPERSGAQYSLANEQISMATGYSMESRKDQGTWRHEYGHFLDHAIGKTRFVSASGDFKKAMAGDMRRMKKDAGFGMRGRDKREGNDAAVVDVQERMQAADPDTQKRMLSKQMDKLGISKDAVKQWLSDDTLISMDDASGRVRTALIIDAINRGDVLAFLKFFSGYDLDDRNIRSAFVVYTYKKGLVGKFSDLIGSATRNALGGANTSAYGNGGHSNAYYKQHGMAGRTTESFANITALLGSGSPMWVMVLEKFTPQMLAAYKETLK